MAGLRFGSRKAYLPIIHLSTKGHLRALTPYIGTMVWEEMIFF